MLDFERKIEDFLEIDHYFKPEHFVQDNITNFFCPSRETESESSCPTLKGKNRSRSKTKTNEVINAIDQLKTFYDSFAFQTVPAVC